MRYAVEPAIMDNILRLFDILPNLFFTTSETKRDY